MADCKQETQNKIGMLLNDMFVFLLFKEFKTFLFQVAI